MIFKCGRAITGAFLTYRARKSRTTLQNKVRLKVPVKNVTTANSQ